MEMTLFARLRWMVKIIPNQERNKPRKFINILVKFKERERGKQPRKWNEWPKCSRKTKNIPTSIMEQIKQKSKTKTFKKIFTLIF